MRVEEVTTSLARSLPSVPEILEGIRSGKYTVWGGVVRVTKGYEGAGQIVGHLVFPNGTKESLNKLAEQFGSIQGQLNNLQSLQVANLALSGLNLVVTAVGFAIVCNKLDHISNALKGHTEKLNVLINLAQKQELRNSFIDAAKFEGLIKSARQFSETSELELLKSLVPQINEQYEFTKYLLLDATRASACNDFVDSIKEVENLSDRLVHLAMVKAHINQKIGHPKFAVESLEDLQKDWLKANQNILTSLKGNKQFVCKLNTNDANKIQSLLKFHQHRLPAIEYQINMLKLIDEKPEAVTLFDSSNDEILFIAA